MLVVTNECMRGMCAFCVSHNWCSCNMDLYNGTWQTTFAASNRIQTTGGGGYGSIVEVNGGSAVTCAVRVVTWRMGDVR